MDTISIDIFALLRYDISNKYNKSYFSYERGELRWAKVYLRANMRGRLR